jgi:hypothetical protein
MYERVVGYLLDDDRFRLIDKTFNGTAKLFEMYAATSELFDMQSNNNILPKEISEEDIQLMEYLKTGKEPTLIDITRYRG